MLLSRLLLSLWSSADAAFAKTEACCQQPLLTFSSAFWLALPHQHRASFPPASWICDDDRQHPRLPATPSLTAVLPLLAPASQPRLA